MTPLPLLPLPPPSSQTEEFPDPAVSLISFHPPEARWTQFLSGSASAEFRPDLRSLPRHDIHCNQKTALSTQAAPPLLSALQDKRQPLHIPNGQSRFLLRRIQAASLSESRACAQALSDPPPNHSRFRPVCGEYPLLLLPAPRIPLQETAPRRPARPQRCQVPLRQPFSASPFVPSPLLLPRSSEAPLLPAAQACLSADSPPIPSVFLYL